MKTSKRLTLIALAVLSGLGAAGVNALAQGDQLVTICFRNRTVQVPNYLLPRYLAVAGTTEGPCGSTQTGG
jgi:ABC-type sugar transport system substrate-binding protein